MDTFLSADRVRLALREAGYQEWEGGRQGFVVEADPQGGWVAVNYFPGFPAMRKKRERGVPLADQRRGAVLAAIRACGARIVGDLGCGNGELVKDLLAERAIEQVIAADVSARALQNAARTLHLDTMPERQRARLQIFQSALTYRDDRLARLDAAVLMEVIEHVDAARLDALGRTVFGAAAPATVIVTTPNAEYNVRFATLPAGAMRHHDHRFEWTRPQFRSWADAIGARYGYDLRYLPVGPDDPAVGPPTQLAIFSKVASA